MDDPSASNTVKGPRDNNNNNVGGCCWLVRVLFLQVSTVSGQQARFNPQDAVLVVFVAFSGLAHMISRIKSRKCRARSRTYLQPLTDLGSRLTQLSVDGCVWGARVVLLCARDEGRGQQSHPLRVRRLASCVMDRGLSR